MATAYLTGANNPWAEALADEAWGRLGILLQPGNAYHRRVNRFAFWAADNGCFSSKGFDIDKWWSWLEGLVESMADLEWDRHELEGGGEEWGPAETCLFAVAPDVVGDAHATLKRSRPWLSKPSGSSTPRRPAAWPARLSGAASRSTWVGSTRRSGSASPRSGAATRPTVPSSPLGRRPISPALLSGYLPISRP